MVRHELLQLVKNVPLCHSSVAGRSKSLWFMTGTGLYAPASTSFRGANSKSKPHRSLIEIWAGNRPPRLRAFAFLFSFFAFFLRADFSDWLCSSLSRSGNWKG